MGEGRGGGALPVLVFGVPRRRCVQDIGSPGTRKSLGASGVDDTHARTHTGALTCVSVYECARTCVRGQESFRF